MSLELNNLTPNPGARKKRKRVGRGPGSGNGKTSGKGHKGQQARSGYSRRIGFEGGQNPLYRRLPTRGFRHADKNPANIVNIDALDRYFEDGAEINIDTLAEKGLADGLPGGVKILGRGETTKKFTITVQAASPGAREKIEKAGGTINIVVRAPKASAE